MTLVRAILVTAAFFVLFGIVVVRLFAVVRRLRDLHAHSEGVFAG